MGSYSIPAEFVRHQVTILGVLADAKPLLAGKDRTVWPTLILYRGRLARLLRAYQAFKHEELFDPAIAAGSADGAAATVLKAGCVQLATDYRAHAARYASVDIDSQWSGYRLAALSMMRQLENGIIREGELVRTLGAMARTTQAAASDGIRRGG